MRTLKQFLEVIPVVLLALCLLGDHLGFSHRLYMDRFGQAIHNILIDHQTQWMIALCIGSYLITFGLMRVGHPRLLFARKNKSFFWLTAFVGILGVNYCCRYQVSSQSLKAITLIGTITIGIGASICVLWRRDITSAINSLRRFLMLTVIALVIACCWTVGSGSALSYRSDVRWSGPFDNPNIYGVLMATGLALACGLSYFRNRTSKALQQLDSFESLPRILMLVCSGILGVGLWESFSRGAWVSCLFGGIYLLSQWNRLMRSRSRRSYNAFLLVVGCGSILIIMYWHFRYAESDIVHRLTSVFNINDFSWRNRTAAWEAALQMMADNPWVGLGWNQPEHIYGPYYSTSRLEDMAAIQTNDHLLLGACLGIPALLCFNAYCWAAVASEAEKGESLSKGHSVSQISENAFVELEWLRIVCRSGALVLGVGFWFDGGLFRMPTAVAFWTLIELGRASFPNYDGKMSVTTICARSS